MFFAANPFCEFQISTQTTAISDLAKALIMQGFDAKVTLLKIYVSLMTLSIILGVIGSFFPL